MVICPHDHTRKKGIQAAMDGGKAAGEAREGQRNDNAGAAGTDREEAAGSEALRMALHGLPHSDAAGECRGKAHSESHGGGTTVCEGCDRNGEEQPLSMRERSKVESLLREKAVDGSEQLRHNGASLQLRSGGERGSPPGHLVSIAYAPEATLQGCKTRKGSSDNAAAVQGGLSTGNTSPAACATHGPGKRPSTTGSANGASKGQKTPTTSKPHSNAGSNVREPQMPVSVVGRTLRKLVELLEQIPPSLGTEEPWKRAWLFTTSWLDDCAFLIAHDHGEASSVRQDRACRPEASKGTGQAVGVRPWRPGGKRKASRSADESHPRNLSFAEKNVDWKK